MELSFQLLEDSFSHDFDRAEIAVLGYLRRSYPAEAMTVFGTRELGRPEGIDSALVRQAAETLLQHAVDNADLPATYRLEWLEHGQVVTTSTGMQVRIAGVEHLFWCGKDRCTMQAVYRDPGGHIIRRGDLIDLRGASSVDTDAHTVIIRRTSGLAAVRRILRNIIKFCEKHAQAHLQKVVC